MRNTIVSGNLDAHGNLVVNGAPTLPGYATTFYVNTQVDSFQATITKPYVANTANLYDGSSIYTWKSRMRYRDRPERG